MATRRLRKNSDLPQNLYRETKKGKVYYKYRHPVKKIFFSMGSSKPEAFAAARILNAQLMGETDLIRKVLATTNKTMAHLIERFREERLPEKGYKPAVEYNWGKWLDRLKRDLGGLEIESLDVQFIASYLDENFQNNSYINHRKVLKELFTFAINKGLFPSDRMNPAEVTYAKPAKEKVRRRLTLEGFNAIHQIAPRWIKIAMELSLLTLQGRNEVVKMKFDDFENGVLKVVREKIEEHEHSHLKISASKLQDILKRSRNSGIASPYVVHRRPERKVKAKGRTHWTQVAPDYLTKAFSKLVDSLEVFAEIPAEERPTFHEIRSLGSWLYKKNGYDNKTYVRPLMAHADEKTTAEYQSGHEETWIEVSADLDIDSLINTKY